jgi:hypothetical protein
MGWKESIIGGDDQRLSGVCDGTAAFDGLPGVEAVLPLRRGVEWKKGKNL